MFQKINVANGITCYVGLLGPKIKFANNLECRFSVVNLIKINSVISEMKHGQADR
jgi:hypothetical protein